MAAKRKPTPSPGEQIGYQKITDADLNDAERKRVAQLRADLGIPTPTAQSGPSTRPTTTKKPLSRNRKRKK